MRRIDIKRLERVLLRLSDMSREGIPVIVEGKRDREALELAGVTGRIFTISMPLEELAEKVSRTSKEAIILTDYDRRGKMLAGRLRELLQNEGVTPNMEIRFELERCTGLEYIEELSSLLLEAGLCDK